MDAAKLINAWMMKMRSNDKLQLKPLSEEVTGLQKAAMLMVALNVERLSSPKTS